MTIEELYRIYLDHPTVCTDTRKITKDCLFFALKGENFDGNSFAAKALEAGAAFAVIDNPQFKLNERCLLVADVLTTLQQLAAQHRSLLTIPVIGLTGTNGKTTTKELIRSVLSQKFKTYATSGNLNNHIGVPLTILGIDKQSEIAIIEMGANHQKEIELLASIAKPTHGLITNVGKAHLEGFGGFEGVKKGKGELYDNLKSSGSTVFINNENEHLMEMNRARQLTHVIYYGNKEGALVGGSIVENNPLLTVKWNYEGSQYEVRTNLTGSYNLENILASIAIGLHFGLSAEHINAGIETYMPGNNRSQVTRTASNTLICDYYNANPSSMSVALENFEAIDAANKVIILGDMFELGEESDAEHTAVLKKALNTIANKRIFIGKTFKKMGANVSAEFFEKTEEAAAELKKHPLQGATILIKGSRGMRMEQLAGLL